MDIDWLHFTPWPALAGGALIGLAAAVLVLGNGRIAGISGILAGWLDRPTGEGPGQAGGWRGAFLAGLVTPAVILAVLGLGRDLGPAITLVSASDWGQLLLAGALVGLGSRLASGCTSGHGVCGLARLSPRSLVSVPTFMAAGMITVWLARHVVEGAAP